MANKKLRKEIEDLEKRIANIKKTIREKNIDISFDELDRKLEVLKTKRPDKAIEIVRLARKQGRPTTLDYINGMITSFIELHGDRRYADDKAIVGGIGFLDDIPVTIIGHQKGRNTKDNLKRNFGMAHPEGYRKALRLMLQAEKFKRSVINLIDTPGAFPGVGAEERGQAEAIAYNLYVMSGIKTPIISIITGEGGSGGALALGVANKVFMLSNAIYSVISPEGCAAILWKDAQKADEAAEALKLTAYDLLRLKVIDDIIDEPGEGAHEDPEEMIKRVKRTIKDAVVELLKFSGDKLKELRYEKFRRMGVFVETLPKDPLIPENF